MIFESFLLNIGVLLVLLVALIFDYVTKFFSYWYIRHIPYKTAIPFFGSDVHRVLGIRSTTDEVNTQYNKHPDAKFVGLIKSRIPDLIVKDPETLKCMLSAESASFHCRGLCLDKSKDICIRNNLFYAEGEKWNLLRENFESILKNSVWRFQQHEMNIGKYLQEVSGEINMQRFLESTLDAVFTDLVFGDANSIEGTYFPELRSELQNRSLFTRFKSYIRNIFPSLYITFGMGTVSSNTNEQVKKILKKSSLLQDVRKLDSLCPSSKKCQQRCNEIDQESDFAASVLMSFITEGYIPCLNILCCIMFELANNPQVQQNARSSKLKAQEEEDDYIDIIIKETMRLYPQYAVLTRKCIKPFRFPDNGLYIDRGVTLSAPVDAIHKDANFHINPEKFVPERFGPEFNEKILESAFLPYGIGPRKCVGEKLSQQIIRGVTEAVLRKYKIYRSGKTPEKLNFKDHNFSRALTNDVYLKLVQIK